MSEPKKYIRESVREAIQKMIIKEYGPGDKLPTEAALVKRFNVSRTSIREALNMIEASGLIIKEKGSLYVTSEVGQCFAESLSFLLQLEIADIQDVKQIRRMLETEAAALAALNADEKQIQNLEDIVWLMQRDGIGIERYIELDIKFHMALAEASCNKLIVQFIRDVTAVMSKFYPERCTLKLIRESSIPLQKKVVTAIRNKNALDARKYMGEHIDEVLSENKTSKILNIFLDRKCEVDEICTGKG
jgi:GntR family transcriptional repressor for pyruvate dehydrogenase complex